MCQCEEPVIVLQIYGAIIFFIYYCHYFISYSQISIHRIVTFVFKGSFLPIDKVPDTTLQPLQR